MTLKTISKTIAAGSSAILMVKEAVAVRIEITSGGTCTLDDQTARGTGTVVLDSSLSLSLPQPCGFKWKLTATTQAARVVVFHVGAQPFPE